MTFGQELIGTITGGISWNLLTKIESAKSYHEEVLGVTLIEVIILIGSNRLSLQM